MNPTQYQIDSDIAAIRDMVELSPANAHQQAQALYHQSEQIQYTYGLVESLILSSEANWHLMNYTDGLKHARRALKVAAQLNHDEKSAKINHLFALHHWGQAKYFTAQRYWLDALDLASLNTQCELEIEALIGLGNVWRITHAYESAEQTHRLAMEMATRNHFPGLTGKAAILLAWDRYLLKNYKGMLSALNIAAKVLEGYPSPTWAAEIYDFRALAYLGLNRFDAAEKASQASINIAEQNQLTWMVAHSAITRARIALMKEEFSFADQLLKEALDAAQKFDNGELLSQISKLLAENAERIGDFKNAVLYYRMYRRFEAVLLREQSMAYGKDKAKSSKSALSHKANKHLRRLELSLETARISTLSAYITRTQWLREVELAGQQHKSDASTIMLLHTHNHSQLNHILGLANTICHDNEFITELDSSTLALLLSAKSLPTATHLLSHFISHFNWENKNQAPYFELLPLVEFNQWWLSQALSESA
uniref:hypothetical protein n=1 Tax=Thaumasiovibrio occultus TaxID=1891184 RepID=UPI00131B0B17|nr:hypothetical protein [Thaumasiovibrio occultus]